MILVAGIGNVFLGDDGFGVAAAHRLSTMDLPENVLVVDYGIRGMHLAYDLTGHDYELTILLDATARGEPPGTVTVLELDPADTPADNSLLDAHGMQPDVVLGLVTLLGGQPGRVVLVGCEPAVLDHQMTLSPPVQRALDLAVDAVLDLIGAPALAMERDG